MSTQQIHLRLQRAREASGFSNATDAARSHGWNLNTYRAHEAGTRNLKHDVAAQYAKAFGVSLAWLLTGDDIATNIGTIVPHLGVVGTVEAGVWREADSAIEEREVVAPRDQRFSRSRQYLLEVRGDSMNLAKPSPLTPGCLIRCVDVRDGEVTLKTGQIVVVERRRDNNYLIETTVKRLTIHPDRYELHPESSNPIHQPFVIKNEGRTQDRTVIEVIALVTGVISEFPL